MNPAKWNKELIFKEKSNKLIIFTQLQFFLVSTVMKNVFLHHISIIFT